MMATPLARTDHRPWPLPSGPWLLAQQWHDLLFAHWPLPATALRPLLPQSLQLDTWEGEAWISIVPFVMRGVRPRGLPAVPWLSHFPELNVRTYVTAPDGTRPGVYFFSLDAGNPVAVSLARRYFWLPYYNAKMRYTRDGATIIYASERTHTGAAPGRFAARYAPTGDVVYTQPGTLDAWLTERYCFYTTDGRGRPLICEIHHAPWPIQPAAAEFTDNDIAGASGLGVPREPALLHFARRLDVVAWLPQQLAGT